MKYQLDSSCVIISLILMTTLIYKALILQGEIWCWSLLGLKGLTYFHRYRDRSLQMSTLQTEPPFVFFFTLSWRKKRGRAWIVSKLQVAAAHISVLVNLVSSRQTRFFECEHLFINKPMVKTIPRARLLGLELNLYPSNKQRMLSKDLTRYIKSLCPVRQNLVSERKELLAGCQTSGPSCSKLG